MNIFLHFYAGKKSTPVFLNRYQKMRKIDAKSYPKTLVLATGSLQKTPVVPISVPPATSQKLTAVSNNHSQKEMAGGNIGKPAPQIIWWYIAIISAVMLFFTLA